jgi:2-polyprenyl-3-methyl-5-hydroxy-6-metoxy-1,4-benzoquinol methylase
MESRTKEPQYNRCIDLAREHPTELGLMSNQIWHDDPKRLAFVLARYKFVAKMLTGLEKILEVGCADAFFTRVVSQQVESLTAIDFDPVFIADAKRHFDSQWPFECLAHDMLSGPLDGGFDAAYALDVIEHIAVADEDRFVGNMVKSLNRYGVCILGSPSLESQLYASEGSKKGHVNCKTGADLRAFMHRFFHNVFLFSMNDEVVHTGFEKMAHYLFVIGCARKDEGN